MYKCKYFQIRELVSPIVYNKWREQAWMFFDEGVLKELDLIRERFGTPIVINNWANNGSLRQCGLRSNLDQIPKTKTLQNQLYLSGHCAGKAFDLHASNNRRLYDLILSMIKQKELKYFRRLENFTSTYTWVHVDTYDSGQIEF